MRVAEVEADADAVPLRASSSTKCTSEPARDSSFGITSTASAHAQRLGEPLQLLDAAARRVAAVVRRRRLLRRGHAQMHDEHLERNPPRDVQRALASSPTRLRARAASALRQRSAAGSSVRRRSVSTIGAWTPCSSARPRPATAAGRRPPPGCGSRSASRVANSSTASNPCAAISSRWSRLSRWP